MRCRFRDKLASSGFLGQRVSDFRCICQTGTMALWADARYSSGTAPSLAVATTWEQARANLIIEGLPRRVPPTYRGQRGYPGPL